MTIYLNERDDDRSKIVGKIMYSRAKEGEYFNATLHDCTHNGIGFVTDYPYLPDTNIFLKSKNEDEPLKQKARIAWSKPINPKDKTHPKFRVGAEFLK